MSLRGLQCLDRLIQLIGHQSPNRNAGGDADPLCQRHGKPAFSG